MIRLAGLEDALRRGEFGRTDNKPQRVAGVRVEEEPVAAARRDAVEDPAGRERRRLDAGFEGESGLERGTPLVDRPRLAGARFDQTRRWEILEGRVVLGVRGDRLGRKSPVIDA